MKAISAAGAALALSLLAACSTAATGHTGAAKSRQAVYMRVVHRELHATNHRGDAAMLKYGRLTCRTWPIGGGFTMRQKWRMQITATTSDTGVTAEQAAALIRAATAAFCPKYTAGLPG